MKRRRNVDLHPNLVNENVENVQVIENKNITPIPIGNIALNHSLPPQFRFYYDFAGKTLGHNIDSLKINFFIMNDAPIPVFEPHDVYVRSFVFDYSGNVVAHPPGDFRFKSNRLFGKYVPNLDLLTNMINFRTATHLRVIDDIDPQLAFLMFKDRRWIARLYHIFRGNYMPPPMHIPDDMFDIYYIAYFLICHALHYSRLGDDNNMYYVSNDEKRVYFKEFRGICPNFFNHPYIHEKLEWAARRPLTDPNLNAILFDLLTHAPRNIAIGGRRRTRH